MKVKAAIFIAFNQVKWLVNMTAYFVNKSKTLREEVDGLCPSVLKKKKLASKREKMRKC